LALNPIFGAGRWPTQHRRGIDRNRLADKLFTLVRVVACDHITPLVHGVIRGRGSEGDWSQCEGGREVVLG
jgi:hypothetical protein